jgi:hypothetical protein
MWDGARVGGTTIAYDIFSANLQGRGLFWDTASTGGLAVRRFLKKIINWLDASGTGYDPVEEYRHPCMDLK